MATLNIEVNDNLLDELIVSDLEVQLKTAIAGGNYKLAAALEDVIDHYIPEHHDFGGLKKTTFKSRQGRTTEAPKGRFYFYGE